MASFACQSSQGQARRHGPITHLLLFLLGLASSNVGDPELLPAVAGYGPEEALAVVDDAVRAADWVVLNRGAVGLGGAVARRG